jgi:hypothetical protein
MYLQMKWKSKRKKKERQDYDDDDEGKYKEDMYLYLFRCIFCFFDNYLKKLKENRYIYQKLLIDFITY